MSQLSLVQTHAHVQAEISRSVSCRLRGLRSGCGFAATAAPPPPPPTLSWLLRMLSSAWGAGGAPLRSRPLRRPPLPPRRLLAHPRTRAAHCTTPYAWQSTASVCHVFQPARGTAGAKARTPRGEGVWAPLRFGHAKHEDCNLAWPALRSAHTPNYRGRARTCWPAALRPLPPQRSRASHEQGRMFSSVTCHAPGSVQMLRTRAGVGLVAGSAAQPARPAAYAFAAERGRALSPPRPRTPTPARPEQPQRPEQLAVSRLVGLIAIAPCMSRRLPMCTAATKAPEQIKCGKTRPNNECTDGYTESTRDSRGMFRGFIGSTNTFVRLTHAEL